MNTEECISNLREPYYILDRHRNNEWIPLTSLEDLQILSNYQKMGNADYLLKKQADGTWEPFYCMHMILRGGTSGPYIETSKYREILPHLLDYFGANFWSPLFHVELSHFGSYINANNRFLLLDDTNLLYKKISPCHQMVITTLLCNNAMAYHTKLPLYILIEIMKFFTQETFRLDSYEPPREILDKSDIWEWR